MSSDLVSQKAERSVAAKKAAAEILREEIREGLDVMERPTGQLFVSALSGGLDVGFSVLLMGVVLTAAEGRLPKPMVEMLVANMYAVGFIFVITGRSELFTEQTTLAVLPVLRGKAKLTGLARLWGVVYAGNLVGAAAFAGMLSYIGPRLGAVERGAFGQIGRRLTEHTGLVMFLSAMLAGWLMGLLSWMVVAARDTIGQIVMVWIVTGAIGMGGLHHVVLGTVEVLTAVFSGQGVTGTDFARFLACATLGNAVGGSVFVALIKYGHAHAAAA